MLSHVAGWTCSRIEIERYSSVKLSALKRDRRLDNSDVVDMSRTYPSSLCLSSYFACVSCLMISARARVTALTRVDVPHNLRAPLISVQPTFDLKRGAYFSLQFCVFDLI